MLTSSVQQIIVYVILAVVAVLWIVRVARIFSSKHSTGCTSCNGCPHGDCPTQKKLLERDKNNWWNFAESNKLYYLCNAKTKGALSEWLGAGLQNRIRRFDSARHLSEMDIQIQISISFYFYNIDCTEEIMGLVDKRKRQIASTTSQHCLYLCLNIILLGSGFSKT